VEESSVEAVSELHFIRKDYKGLNEGFDAEDSILLKSIVNRIETHQVWLVHVHQIPFQIILLGWHGALQLKVNSIDSLYPRIDEVRYILDSPVHESNKLAVNLVDVWLYYLVVAWDSREEVASIQFFSGDEKEQRWAFLAADLLLKD